MPRSPGSAKAAGIYPNTPAGPCQARFSQRTRRVRDAERFALPLLLTALALGAVASTSAGMVVIAVIAVIAVAPGALFPMAILFLSSVVRDVSARVAVRG